MDRPKSQKPQKPKATEATKATKAKSHKSQKPQKPKATKARSHRSQKPEATKKNKNKKETTKIPKINTPPFSCRPYLRLHGAPGYAFLSVSLRNLKPPLFSVMEKCSWQKCFPVPPARSMPGFCFHRLLKAPPETILFPLQRGVGVFRGLDEPTIRER